MSDDLGRGFPGGDPFIDPDDPVAVEREERRREREAKRAEKAAKRKGKAAAAPPPPPKDAPPPTKPRTPEQEFWDEPAEPVTPPPGQEPPLSADPAQAEKAERGRRRLLGRRKGGGAAAAAAADGAAAAESGTPAPPTGESPVPDAAPPTGEQRPAPATRPAERPTGESPRPRSAPATGEQPVPASEPIPPTTEAPHRPASDVPQADPGPRTAETPRPDPNQPVASGAATAEGGPATREHLAQPPRPLEETGAGDWEPPPPRDDWFNDDFHDEGAPHMAGAAATGRRHGDDDGRRKGILGALLRHPFRILAVIIAIVILFFLNSLFQPFHGEGHGHVEVTIPKGSSVGEVGDLLAKKGVIDNSTLFQIRVTLDGKRSSLYAGKFALQKDMSYSSAIDALSEEPNAAKPSTVTVTIPEGYTRKQITQLVKEDGLRGNYMKATVKSKHLDPADYGGKKAKNLEGFLFPDTWELKRHQSVEDLVQLQLKDFKKKIKGVNMKYAKSKNLTVYDVLTIASIVEHESGVASQRKDVASVIYNRLHEGMTLGSDATVRFATGNYTKPLTQSELESESPYNTRTHAGLPPGPISNPGIATIKAAAHPSKSEYLFFVTSPNCKTLNFAKTEAEFERDVKKYEASKCTE
ncbi:MAG: endolytic transglycosylase MltG [Solirubrobacterales bacterium]